MKIIFLGTGTSTGVPQIACNCKVCKSTDPKDKRLRSSVLVSNAKHNVLIDCGPDFRQQLLQHTIHHIDSILLTHEHYDHVSGLDEVRPLREVTVYAEKRVLEVVKKNLPYVFNAHPYPGAPKINLLEIKNDTNLFQVPGFEIQPIRLFHHKLPILGFRIANFAYLTDFSSIEETQLKKLEGLEVLVLDALRKYPHPAHVMLSEALQLVDKIKPQKAYFTHLSHEMGLHNEEQQLLPENVFFAWDGLQIEL
ncbi:MAG: MBL fold metallo-hydrolase [Paludibacteraceae bacterium]|nr:MBL fold metallo-hydrolase [Paludibacteraceae bacterium]MBN2786922.1 MBL fold metallo-hydrolase [Paludibacteraceae bacterium]